MSTGGYSATVDASSRTSNKTGGPVEIETNPATLEIIEETEEWLVAKSLWVEALPIIDKANKTMKEFITSNYSVCEFHPMIEEFTELSDFTKRLQESLSKNDNSLFKREKKSSVIG